ncbi:MAG: hypothetical protein GX608_13980 [Lentisphaerae bacterium]|nr:hypothetical protein [Lentisphaerota bacterium]
MKEGAMVCVLAAVLLMSAQAGAMASNEPMCGGWSAAAASDSNVVAAAQFAVKAEEKALREKGGAEPAGLELAEIREAAQQVVAGVNYRLKLTVRLDGRQKEAEAIVWWQAWREPEPYQLTSWNWE